MTFSITAACSRRPLVKRTNGEVNARLQTLSASMSKHHLLWYFYFSNTQVRTVRHSYFSPICRAICNTVHTTPSFVHFLFSYYFFLRVLGNKLKEERNTLLYPEMAKQNQEHGESIYKIVPFFFDIVFHNESHLRPWGDTWLPPASIWY